MDAHPCTMAMFLLMFLPPEATMSYLVHVGYFLAGVLAALAAFLLFGRMGAVLRALRHPAPAALPANVIPFRRPAPAPREHPGYHRRSLD
jgi:hypothetical protein